ncbi:MAG TPA: hypothetical protein VJC03_01715, partial [bacterium]|nr:hypothetical protein [bacterium]
MSQKELSVLRGLSVRKKEVRSSLIEKARACSVKKRYDAEKKEYADCYEQAAGYLIKALRLSGVSGREIKAFLERIEELMPVIIEDPAEAWEMMEKDGSVRLRASDFDSAPGLIVEMKRKKAVMDKLKERGYRYNSDLFLQRMVVPDGTGGYFIDTIATPGRWMVRIDCAKPDGVKNSAVIRLLDALADVTKNPDRPADWGALAGEVGRDADFETVYVLDSVEKIGRYREEESRIFRSESFPDVRLEITADNKKRLYILKYFLAQTRKEQRRSYRKAFSSLRPFSAPGSNISRRSAAGRKQIAASDKPVLAFFDFSSNSPGINVVRQILRLRGYVLREVKSPDEIRDESPVICLSVFTNAGMKQLILQLKKIRNKYPDAFIVLGGLLTRLPKPLLALLPEINVLIRGEGEKVLPEVLGIIGRTRLRDGLTRGQYRLLERISGIFVRTPDSVMLNNFETVNMVVDFDMPFV